MAVAVICACARKPASSISCLRCASASAAAASACCCWYALISCLTENGSPAYSMIMVGGIVPGLACENSVSICAMAPRIVAFSTVSSIRTSNSPVLIELKPGFCGSSCVLACSNCAPSGPSILSNIGWSTYWRIMLMSIFADASRNSRKLSNRIYRTAIPVSCLIFTVTPGSRDVVWMPSKAS